MNRRGFLGGMFAALGYSVLQPVFPASVVEEALTSPATHYRAYTLAEVNAAIKEILIPIIEDAFNQQSSVFANFLDEQPTGINLKGARTP
jgi:hypothetical protein